AQGVVDPGLQVGTADLVAADPDVGCEQVHMGIEIAHVERQRILAGELADGVDRLEAIDAGEQVGLRCGGRHAGAAQMKAMPPLTAMFCPVMKLASSLARKPATRAISSGSHMRP